MGFRSLSSALRTVTRPLSISGKIYSLDDYQSFGRPTHPGLWPRRKCWDWLYVEDACRAIDQVLTQGKIGEAYNIGGESERPNIEVARQVLSYLKKGSNICNSLPTGRVMTYATP